MPAQLPQPSIVIDHKKKLRIPLHEIILLRGDVNYTDFVFQYRRQYTVSHSLKHFEETLLANGFLRIHRSHLVNSRFIKSTNLLELTVILMDGTELKVARRRVKEIELFGFLRE
ncbi:MAG: LytTR family DNA-binding domain-containing protein [Arcicella sp.]|nr:LytTR family DNA-binding domain-containing protein [Arcicella sp.]